eukprot:1161737-Pelagomonas_calceolata.AAC.2
MDYSPGPAHASGCCALCLVSRPCPRIVPVPWSNGPLAAHGAPCAGGGMGGRLWLPSLRG